MRAKPISLYRPRRSFRALVMVGVFAAATMMIVVAVCLPGWLRWSENGLPRAQGVDAIGPLVAAQDRFYDTHGRYAVDVEELDGDTASGFRHRPDLMVRLDAAADGAAYVAGAVGFTGEYAAVIQAAGAEPTRGAGATYEAAIADAGWSPQWAAEAGFDPLAERDHSYGAYALRGGEIIELRTSVESPGSTVTIRRVPVAGSGDTWQDAVTQAGADPGIFDWSGTPAATPVTVKAGDATATMTVALSSSGQVDARVDYTGTTTAVFGEPEDAIAAAGIRDNVLEGLNTWFTCATSYSPNGIFSVTLCDDAQGQTGVYSTAGTAASSASLADAFETVGATDAWAREHDIVLPTPGDLL